MKQVYTVLLYLSIPVMLLRLLWRSLKLPAYRHRIGERFGWLRVAAVKESVWIHAVSVGEVQAAEPLIRWLLDQYPTLTLVVTTTTPTGSERVRKLFSNNLIHLYFPYDLPFAINGFLKRLHPSLLVMIETEIWPNLLAICERQGITTILANGRMSERSARGYHRVGAFTRATFARIALVAAQTKADADRFVALGVARDSVQVTGSIKFDIRLPASLFEQAAVVRRSWGDRPVWLAASTHEGEEELVLAAHRRVLRDHSNALLVLVPRHPERFERVALLCRREEIGLVRRSSGKRAAESDAVFLVDTMGELTLFIAATDVTFVGGSLIPVGGHNVLEPAALGVPILFGPHMFNFLLISEMLLQAGAAIQVAGSEQLADKVSNWFADASARTEAGERGRRLVAENRGALDRLSALITHYLPPAV
ncbi:MAG: lipid IV(A) 3-deoxy-D-manno-octulosonic acid transferase [Gammaproteobacteria bacterium]|nr:lipid IV(A) 3-deoxy-D-manno-octulosonic acid transferase [Gammaproteobacteria bacterium]